MGFVLVIIQNFFLLRDSSLCLSELPPKNCLFIIAQVYEGNGTARAVKYLSANRY